MVGRARTGAGHIAPLDPNVRYPREAAYETLVSSSWNAEWQQRLTTAPRFFQYIERDVIGNSAAFGTLTFWQRRCSHLTAREALDVRPRVRGCGPPRPRRLAR